MSKARTCSFAGGMRIINSVKGHDFGCILMRKRLLEIESVQHCCSKLDSRPGPHSGAESQHSGSLTTRLFMKIADM